MRIAIVLVAVLLGACKAKVTANGNGGGGAPAKPFMDPKPTITGPNVTGHWRSACKPKSSTNAFRQFDFTFTAETVQRKEMVYSDRACTALVSTDLSSGRYRFIEQYRDGGFNIEYAFDLGGGITSYPQEKFKILSGYLYISDFVIGDIAPVLMNEPLAPDGMVLPDADAQVASSYSVANHAWCSNQTTGFMVDFTGYDLSREGEGEARVGSKRCGSNRPMSWAPDKVYFTVRLVDGQPQIEFPNTRYADYIQPSDYANGLSTGQSAYSSFSGNSGECFFLTNEGTKGAPFTYECE